MKNTYTAGLLLSLSMLTMHAFAANGQERYMVKFQPGTASSVKEALSKRGGVVHVALDRMNVVSVSLPTAALKGFVNNPNIIYIERDPLRYPSEITSTTETVPWGIEAVQANEIFAQSTKSVCVIDSGYDVTHPDLPSNVTGTSGYAGAWNQDGLGHGTHVSGTIAALGGNGIGVVGVVPNGYAPIHMVRVFDDYGNGSFASGLIGAAMACEDAGHEIINMSLGGIYSSRTEADYFSQAAGRGVLSIAAAGNSGDTSYSYPASYKGVVSVAAIDGNLTQAVFSQSNSEVELAAPGTSVLSTVPAGGYRYANGTSMATPHVAGVAALVWANNPQCTNSQIRAVLNASALDIGAPGRDNQTGYGLVQARSADELIKAAGCDVVNTGSGKNTKGNKGGKDTGDSTDKPCRGRKCA